MQTVMRDFVLILNPGKCGSSWLAHGLTVRPYLAFVQELDFIRFLRFPPEQQWNEVTSRDPAFLAIKNDPDLDEATKLLKLYEIERNRNQNIAMLIDKTPSNIDGFLNFRHLYREAKIIVLHRDPRDCFVSNEFFHQRQLEKIPVRDDIDEVDYLRASLVLRYTLVNCGKTLSAEKQLRLDGIPFLRLTYEEMRANYIGTLKRVFDFLDLHIAQEAPVRSNYVPDAIPFREHLERAQSFRPLFRKGIVGDWKNHIQSRAAKDLIKEMSGDLLIQLGYETSDEW